MSANLVPFSSAGGFTTAGNITVSGVASPAPNINGFSSVNSENISLSGGRINGGTATVVPDGINSIALAPGAQMDVYGFPFNQSTRGQLTITGITTPSEANGTWYYQSINTNAYQIYTDSTYSTLVDATGWSAYTGGGSVEITKRTPATNIVINSNGFLTTFANTGSLTLPGSLNSAANLTITANTQSWTFDNTGVATLPGEGVLQSISDSVTLRSLNTTTGNANSVYLGSSGGLGFNDQEIGGNWLEIFRNGTEPEIRVPVGLGNLNIQTASGNTPYNWVFDDTGNLSAPGNVIAQNFIGNISITGNITGTTANVSLVAGSYTATFDNLGVLTLPAVGSDEGGEINFGAPTANTTLIGPVKLDVYQDRIRFFDGSTKGAYIDLSQAAAGVGSLLNNRVSAFVNAGTYVTMDNIKATVTTTGNRGLSLATVSGSFNYSIGGTYGAGVGGSGGSSTGTLTTTPTTSIFGWGFTATGDIATYVITNTSSLLTYRITVQIGASFNNNSIIIERLI